MELREVNVTVRYEDKVRFRAESRGHVVVCDQPESNKGENGGMTPPEFLLVSLGTCAGYYAVEYLKARNLPVEGLEVRVHAAKASGPARIGEFRIAVRTGELEERHREGVMRAVKACLVHNTLLHPPKVEVELESAVAA
jgi:putative redox protein